MRPRPSLQARRCAIAQTCASQGARVRGRSTNGARRHHRVQTGGGVERRRLRGLIRRAVVCRPDVGVCFDLSVCVHLRVGVLEDGHDGALGAVLRHEAAALGVVLDELGDVVARDGEAVQGEAQTCE